MTDNKNPEHTQDGEALLKELSANPGVAEICKMIEISNILEPYRAVYHQVLSAGSPVHIVTTTNTSGCVTL